MTVIHNIKEVYDIFLNRDNHKSFNMTKEKAGLWQGTDSFKDLDMFILRDVNLYQDIPEDVNKLVEQTKPDTVWAETHFQERIGGKPLNPGESYKIWPYANFDKNTEFRKNELFDHTYMERFWAKEACGDKFMQEDSMVIQQGINFDYGDYNDVVNQLTNNPLTRQAYLPIFFPEDTGAINNIRVPCTLGYLFEIVNNQLNITYYIRSCDIYRHLRNDIYMAGRLLQHTKNILFINGNKDIKTGMLIMKIANLHLFENDVYPLTKKERKL